MLSLSCIQWLFLLHLQVPAFALFLMDGESPNVAKLDQRKRINIAKLDKIFQVSEFILKFASGVSSRLYFVLNEL